MTIILTTVTFPRTNGVPKDSVVNTFHHETPLSTIGPADLSAIREQIRAFYTTTPPGSPAVTQLFSKYLSGQGVFRQYDLNSPMPRPDIGGGVITFTPPSSSPPLPSEVAIVLSFRRPPFAGVRRESLRNRIYLGPLNSTFAADQQTNDLVVNGLALVTLKAVASAMVNAGSSAGAPRWVVYSGTRRKRGLTPFSWPVELGHADNAFDTQRRRGSVASLRVNFP